MTGFLLLILFGYVIYLHTKISDLGRRLSRGAQLPNDLKDSKKLDDFPKPKTAVAATEVATGEHVFNSPLPDQESALWKWISTDWPLKLGALLVILGLGWFVSYAFAQNWIGPIGRITLGFVFGSVMLLAGFLRAQKNEHQGTIIMGVGAAAILMTTYAAREVYDFFTPTTALLLMASASVFIAYSSVVDKVMSRSLVGLLVGCIAPFLTVSANPSVSGLFMYLFVLISANIWIVTLTGWKELLVAAAGIYGVFSALGVSGTIYPSEKPTMIVLITAFIILFYGVGVISAVKSKKVVLADVFIKLLSAGIFMLWVHTLVAPHWQSMVMVLASLLTALAAWGLQLQTANKWLVVLHSALALIYLAIAVAFELEGVVALLAYIGLTAVGAWLAGTITDNYKVGQFFGAPFFFIFFVALGEVGYYPLWKEIAVVGILAAVLIALGVYWYGKLTDSKSATPPSSELVTLYLYAALLTSVVFVWISSQKVFLSRDTAHAFSLIVFTLLGVAMYGYGQLYNWKKTKIAGSVLLGGVILRLLFVEVWNMVLAARVIVFTMIGALLMGVAFLRPVQTKQS